MAASKINYLAWSPVSIRRGTERHSVRALSRTFNLKDNVVFHFEGHLWYRSDVVCHGWEDCRITSKHSLIQISPCESWLEGGSNLPCVSQVGTEISESEKLLTPSRLNIRVIQTEKLPPFHSTTTSLCLLAPSSHLEEDSTCVKQTSTEVFGYAFAATSRYGSIMESAQCTGV